MHLAPLIKDLAVILGVAALVTYLFRRIGQPVVLGYVVAGLIVGPYTPPVLSIVDVESVKIWAELGVIFLMFALGLEFSFRRLAKVGVSAGATAVVQIMTMIFWGYLCGHALGWASIDSVFLGCMISISSTTIIIKALDELGLKTRRFSELVFGILIVEDLAAILMLVALASIASKESVSSLDLLAAGGKLALVVGAWLVIGMFAVPRFVRAVGRRGNDEMLVVVSLGLCLALVSLSAFFHYSVALGAFIMGSIIAETKEAHRIEELVKPLKDVFGAVFFVSVGMLLDPVVLVGNLPAVLAICAVIITGKIASVTFGALATGQTVATAVQSGFAMAQIGEFSFIIATLGLSYGAIDAKLYPIIVAASLLTTFTTPYLIRAAPRAAQALDSVLPERARVALERYGNWFRRAAPGSNLPGDLYCRLARWAACAIVVITVFVVAAVLLVPWLGTYFDDPRRASAVGWSLAFAASAPFVWAMLAGGGGGRGPALLIRRLATVTIIGLLSLEFFAVWVSVVVTVSVAALVFLAFRRQIASYYRWIETTFVEGIGAGGVAAPTSHAHLLPWDARLAEVEVVHRSRAVGATLREMKIRERFGINVVAVRRDDETVVAPGADLRLLPGDVLLCFGTDDELDRLHLDVERASEPRGQGHDLRAYALRRLDVEPDSTLVGRSLRDSRITEEYGCLVVGLEREQQRLRNLRADLALRAGDSLWVVGEADGLRRLSGVFSPSANWSS